MERLSATLFNRLKSIDTCKRSLYKREHLNGNRVPVLETGCFYTRRNVTQTLLTIWSTRDEIAAFKR
jgi:hypothetical protein